MSIKSIVSLFAALTALAWSTVAVSHDPENNPGQAAHGGQYVEYEQHHGIEMVSDKGKLIFHITENLKPVDMTGSTFKVFIQTETGTQTIQVKSDGPKLVADLDAALPEQAKIVLTGRDSDGHTMQARFVTK